MKTMTMYRPATQSVLTDFDRCMESFFRDSSSPFGLAFTPAYKPLNQTPAVDIKETENSYLLEMELPGCDEKNIEVHVDGSNLTISSRQEKASEETRENFILKERKTSSFSRSFKLAENADPSTVSAVFKNGVLSLNIAKRAEAQKRVIQINAA